MAVDSAPEAIDTVVSRGGGWRLITLYFFTHAEADPEATAVYSNPNPNPNPNPNQSATEPCAADELVLQPPPSAWQPLNWLGFGQSWNSYVVDAPAGRELHCYGS